MNTTSTKNKTHILVPALIGAAAAGALTYLLVSDDTADLRSKLADSFEKGLDSLKEQFPDLEKLAMLKDHFLENITDKESATNTGTETVS